MKEKCQTNIQTSKGILHNKLQIFGINLIIKQQTKDLFICAIDY